MNLAEKQAEIERLISNQESMLDTLPVPVMVIKDGNSLEFLNNNAHLFFKKFGLSISSKKEYHNDFFNRFLDKIRRSNSFSSDQQLPRIDFENLLFEFTLAPFHGYKDDSLEWLILRDITYQKRHEEEISQFHNNIEAILSQKIKKLKESEKIRAELAEQLISLKTQIANLSGDDAMIGSSRAMSELRDMITTVAKTDATILVTGESGTGKELVANLLRETSNRNKRPFLKINCNTINDSLLESDLFGHEKGAFTGAHAQVKGKFEVVDGGTIFLDEIGDISPRMQASLLRVLQDGEIIRVGGNKPIQINVRILAATNRDLALAVQDGSFRLDLYYRLNIINILIPPLRERLEDIEDLVSHFVRRYRLAFKKDVNFVPRPIIDKLKKHSWPGNVRELENVIQRAVLMAKSNIITEHDIFFDLPPGHEETNGYTGQIKRRENTPLKTILAEVEKEVIIDSLQRHHGNAAKAAKELKVGKTAFYDKLKRFDISTKDHR